jgi:hypothetical protein
MQTGMILKSILKKYNAMYVDWTHLAWNRAQSRALVCEVMKLRVLRRDKSFLICFSRRILFHVSLIGNKVE